MLSRKERGASLAGWIFMLLVLGTVATAGTKLAPLYFDHNTISNLMDKMAEDDGLADKRTSDLIKVMEGRLKLNNIRNFPLEDNIVVERTKNGTNVKLDYEVRVPFFGNVDMVASFDKQIELRK
ncbi:MAG: hypothetical protein ACI9FB_004291 [Candidatus Azotimanducaceae bacterium]|jgi:hypothetical protein